MDGGAFGDGFRNQLLDEDAQYDRLSSVYSPDDEGSLYDHLAPQESAKGVSRLSVAGDPGSPIGYVVAGAQQPARVEPQWQYSGIAQSVESVLESRGGEPVRFPSPGKLRESSTQQGGVNPAFADFAAANAAGGALSARLTDKGVLTDRGVHFASADGQSPEAQMSPSVSDSKWKISSDERKRYEQQFHTLKTSSGYLSGRDAREFFLKSKLPNSELSAIWKLSDLDEDGKLSIGEFCVAVHIVIHRRRGDEIPAVLPAVLWPKKSEQFDIESAFNELGSSAAQRISAEAFQPVPTRKDSAMTLLSPGQGTTNVPTSNDVQVGTTSKQTPKKPMNMAAPVAEVQMQSPHHRRQSDPLSQASHSKVSGNLVRESKPLVLENPLAQMGLPLPPSKDKPLPAIPGIAMSDVNETDGNPSVSRESLSPENEELPLMPPLLPMKKKVSQSIGIGKHVTETSTSKFVPPKSPTLENLTVTDLPPPPIEKPVDLLAGDTKMQFVMDKLAAPSLPPKKKSSTSNIKRSKSQRDRQSNSQSKLKRRASKEAAGYSQLDDDACSLGDASPGASVDAHMLQTHALQPTVHDLVSVVAPVVRVTQSPVVGRSSNQDETDWRKKGHSRSSSLDLNVVMKSQEFDEMKTDTQPFTDLPPTPPPKDFPAVLPKRKSRKHAPEPPSPMLEVKQPSPGKRKGHKKSASLDILSSSPDIRDITRHIRSMTPDSQTSIGASPAVEIHTITQKPVVREKKKAPPIPPSPYKKKSQTDMSLEATIAKDSYASVNKTKKDKATLEEEIRQLKNRFLELKRLNTDLHSRLMELKEQRSSLQVEKEILEQSRSDIQQ